MLYMDYAATTPVKKAVLKAMLPYFMEHWENPSAKSRQSDYLINQIRKAREQVAESIHAEPEEIYFTSGGTEADNWVIKCIPGIRNIITTTIEHSAVYHACKDVEKRGVNVCYMSVDRHGNIEIPALTSLLEQTAGGKTLVSVIYANNEIGTIQKIGQIAGEVHKYRAYLHTDAVQAYGRIPLDAKQLDADFISASGHKIGAPKGIGFLYKKSGTEISPLIHGGKQEANLRGGTENVPYIIGMGIAATAIHINQKSISDLRDYAINRILAEIPFTILNGEQLSNRLPNNINLSFKDIYGESLQMILESSGYIVSNGSACNAGITTGNRILQAIGVPEDYIYGTIRITISKDNTKEELDEFVDALKEIVQMLREDTNSLAL